MAIKSVSDSGPLMHLSELEMLELMKIFSPVAVPPEVKKECKKIRLPFFIRLIQLKQKSRDFSALLLLQYGIDLGEAESIALVRQDNVPLLFTDDLDARETAKMLGIEVHGTIGILLRAFRNKKISKQETLKKLDGIKSTTLFITSELIEFAKRSVEKYRE